MKVEALSKLKEKRERRNERESKYLQEQKQKLEQSLRNLSINIEQDNKKALDIS